jgi:hypothetical protein
VNTEHMDISDFRHRLPTDLEQPVELETVSHRGERRTRRFESVRHMMHTIALEKDGLTCAHGYDPQTDTDLYSPDEIDACTFAAAIDDYPTWTVAPVRTLDELREATAQRARAEENWRLAMHDAREAGFSLRAIAEASGVSHQTVVNLLRDVELGIVS